MNIVIIGAGEVGYSVARNLSSDGHDITIVESDPDRAAKAENELDVMVIRGNGSRPNVLEKAGIVENTSVEMLIACSSRDEVNIVACWIAKKMGVKRVISRAVGMEYTDTDTWKQALGIDMMVSPERSVAREVEGLLETRGAVHSIEIDQKAGIYAFRVAEDCPVNGLSLIEMRTRNPRLVTIVVYIKRGNDGFIPLAKDRLQTGDLCYSFCYLDQIQEIAELYQSHKSKKLKRVLIVGAGKIGFQTAQLLHRKVRGVDIRLIDIDREKCRRVASELSDILVLWGDGADDDLLVQEGIVGSGGFVAATDSDELNLVMAVLAKRLGTEKSISVIRRKNYMKLGDDLPIDAIVNRNEALSSVIISSVRYPGHANTLAIFDQLGAETLQVIIPPESPAIDVPLYELPLPVGTLIGLVRSKGIKKDLYIPTGTAKLKEGDTVFLFAATEAVEEALKVLGVETA